MTIYDFDFPRHGYAEGYKAACLGYNFYSNPYIGREGFEPVIPYWNLGWTSYKNNWVGLFWKIIYMIRGNDVQS